MGEAEDQLVDDLVGADGAADRPELGVGRIAANEVVLVEALQLIVPDAAGHGRHVVDVGPFDHGRHGGIDVARLELVAAMGFPHGDEIGSGHGGIS
jgi:hypothetical protein